MMTLPGTSPYLAGMHEPMPRTVMRAGWILFPVEVGHGPDPHPGVDFGEWEAQGYGIICRIQHEWGDGGTLPKLDDLAAYVERVRTLVQNSRFCHRWIIGNEPNIPVEWPDGWPLQPGYVAECYNFCWQAIHELPGHEFDEVIVPPVGPWNDLIGIGWVEYFQQMTVLCEFVDAFAIHSYTHGSDPRLVTSETMMGAPYQNRHYEFRAYRDWMRAIPAEHKALPVYLTEANQNGPWLDEQNGWIPEAYREIDDWNHTPGNQTIRALIVYRWPCYDDYCIEGRGNVITDFQRAQAFGYTWEDPLEPPVEPPQEDALKNPSVELPYYRDEQNSTVEVAHDWLYFASDGKPPERDGPCQLPEYKSLSTSQDARRVWDGNTAQCWFIRWKIFDAGIYQTIDVIKGEVYEFNAMCQAWCSQSDDPTVSDGDMHVMLGIDPAGGTDAFAATVIWSQWERVGADYQKYYSPEVEAQGRRITVFVRAWNKWELSHNDMYVDDMHLVQVSEPPTLPPGGSEPVDYERIRQIVREELADRAPVVWPR